MASGGGSPHLFFAISGKVTDGPQLYASIPVRHQQNLLEPCYKPTGIRAKL
jgi:hypothetical protein